MKFVHLADLHIDKKVFGYSLAEEQRDVLGQVIEIVRNRKADGVLIAGDVYDTSVPNIEGVSILDEFLSELHALQVPVFMISGNHDSGVRLGFGSQILDPSGLHIAGQYDGSVPHWDLSSGDETVRIHLLPYIKPFTIRSVLKEECSDWTQSVERALKEAEMLEGGKNIVLSHQYFAGGVACESEQMQIGGLDQVDAKVLEPFDYAALGHLHNPQCAGRAQNRYPGTLLKFSASELNVQKTITLVDTSCTPVAIEEIPVTPKRDFVRIQGLYQDLISKPYAESQNLDNYFYICLEDEIADPDVLEKLRLRYPRILKVEYLRNYDPEKPQAIEDVRSKMKSHDQILEDFYRMQNGCDLDDSMKEVLTECWEEIHEAH